jgi:choloylglycine hydrolase
VDSRFLLAGQTFIKALPSQLAIIERYENAEYTGKQSENVSNARQTCIFEDDGFKEVFIISSVRFRQKGVVIYRTILFLHCLFLITLLNVHPLQACTSFVMEHENQLLFGRNFDWYVEDCFLMINKRGLSKSAMPPPAADGDLGDRPARWISKYGSLTFNQLGRELPLSGMNEAGLVISAMAVWGAKFPLSDSRPALWNWQWIQYQLDNCRTVQEVITSDRTLRIIPQPNKEMKGHYLVCDAGGNSAVIEFLDGKLVYYNGETMPVKVLTNTVYAKALDCLQPNCTPESCSGNSVARFKKAAEMMGDKAALTSKTTVDYAFSILKNVGFFKRGVVSTEWSIVYDLLNRRVYFHTFENHSKRYVDLSQFDFSCQTPVQVLNIHKNISGNVSGNFIDYTPQGNRNLIGKTFKASNFLSDGSDEVLDKIAQYPDTAICRQ